MTTPEHVVFGTDAVGLATFEALRRRGANVRLVNRTGQAPVPNDPDTRTTRQLVDSSRI